MEEETGLEDRMNKLKIEASLQLSFMGEFCSSNNAVVLGFKLRISSFKSVPITKDCAKIGVQPGMSSSEGLREACRSLFLRGIQLRIRL